MTPLEKFELATAPFKQKPTEKRPPTKAEELKLKESLAYIETFKIKGQNHG